MTRPISPAEAGQWLRRLGKAASRTDCSSCDCLQGLLTQLELDCPGIAAAAGPLKVPAGQMHGCLGCDPCGPGEVFADYLRRQNQPDGDPAAAPGTGGADPRGTVRTEYGRIARSGGSCCGASSCCGGPPPDAVASAVGYSAEELAGLPEGANMGLSCGNPTALASLRPGEVVLDLGSGGGFDVFIAARKVGPSGRAIGVDMTPDMLEKARRNIESFRSSTGLDNAEFRLGEIEHLPAADNSVDVVISNCVINLSPDKAQVWREVARVLRPGGRVAVSDLALLRPLPDAVRESVTALVGCIAGAVLIEDTRKMIEDAGLVEIEFETESGYIDRMAEWSDPLYREIAANLPAGTKAGDFVTSLRVAARKRGAGQENN